MKAAQRDILANPQHPDTKLSPAERTAKLLAFRPGYSHNFASTPQPSKPIHRAVGAMRTSA